MSFSPEPFGQPLDPHVLLKQLYTKLTDLSTRHDELAARQGCCEKQMHKSQSKQPRSLPATGNGRKPRKGRKERRRLQKKHAQCHSSETSDGFEMVDNIESNSGNSSVDVAPEAGGSCRSFYENANGYAGQPAITWNHGSSWNFTDEVADLQELVKVAEKRAEVAEELGKWKFKDEIEALRKRAEVAEHSADARAEVAEELGKWKFKDELDALRKRAESAEHCAKVAEEVSKALRRRAESAEQSAKVAEELSKWKFNDELEALHKRAESAEHRAKIAEKHAEVAEEVSKWKFKDELEDVRKRAEVAEDLASVATKRASVGEEELIKWKVNSGLEIHRMRVALASAEERAKVAEDFAQQAWAQSQDCSIAECNQPIEQQPFLFGLPSAGVIGICHPNCEPACPSVEGLGESNLLAQNPETVGGPDHDMAVELVSEVNLPTYPLSLRFGSVAPGLTRNEAQFCPFWKHSQSACGAGCQFSQDLDLQNMILRPQTWTSSECEVSAGATTRPLVFSVTLHPVAIAFVKFYSFDLCVSFASSPPATISRMQVTIEQCKMDVGTVVIRFSGHHEDLDAEAIAEEVNINLRAHSRIAFLHMAPEQTSRVL